MGRGGGGGGGGGGIAVRYRGALLIMDFMKGGVFFKTSTCP